MLIDAEHHHTTNLAAAGKLDLAGQGDGPVLRSAASLLQAVPATLAATHQQLQHELEELLAPAHQLTAEFKAAGKTIRGEAAKVCRAGVLLLV